MCVADEMVSLFGITRYSHINKDTKTCNPNCRYHCVALCVALRESVHEPVGCGRERQRVGVWKRTHD